MAALFNANDSERIVAKIREVEARTSGEIVVAVIERAADHAGPRAVLTVALTLLSGAALHLAWPSLDLAWIFAAQAVAALAGGWLSGLGPIVRALVPDADLDAALRERALVYFADHGLHRTREHSGVLILVSRREHRVQLLGDVGVHTRVRTEGWQAHADAIAQGVRAGRGADALLAVLDELGAVLAKDFPRGAADTNELPDAVRQDPATS